MKRFEFKKLAILTALSLGSLTVANAQWSTQDINSNAIKQLLTDVLNANKTQIKNQEAQQAATKVLSQQSSTEMVEADRRNRANTSMADTIKRDRDAMPTIQQCIDKTRGKAAGAASKSARRGGGGNSNKMQAEIKNDELKLVKVVEKLKELKACGLTPMEQASDFCQAGEQEYVAAAYSARGLTGNVKGEKERSFKNFSIDKNGDEAANIYINTATLSNAPTLIDENLVKDNEAYIASYNKVMNGLMTAHDAMQDVKNEYVAFDSSSMSIQEFDTYWDKITDTYKDLDMEVPEKPSLGELVIGEVWSDFFLAGKKPKDASDSEIENLKQINRKLSVSNYIAQRQARLSEIQVLLLAQLVSKEAAKEAKDLSNVARGINSNK